MQASNHYEAGKPSKKPQKLEVSSNAVALKPSTPSNNKSKNWNKTRSSYCKLCSTKDHSHWACPNFSSIQDKTKEIRRLNLCNKCASNVHISSACDFKFYKNCSTCNGKHLSWLCNRSNNSSKFESIETNK